MDKRELILVRLLAVLAALKASHGVKLVERNRLEASEQRRPAIILLDADEGADDSMGGNGRRPAHAPNLVGMTPEIHILVMEGPDTVGSGLNALRATVIKAIIMDEELRGLCHSGDIRYEGCATGLSAGRSLVGEMALSFTLTYVLNPLEM